MPLPDSETPQAIASTPAGIAGVSIVACDQTPETGSVARSVQYSQPEAVWMKAVTALLGVVARYQTDSR